MYQTRKGNQWYFRMKAYVDEFSGLVHDVHCTAANVADVPVTHTLLHGKDESVFGDSDYTGAGKRNELLDCEAAFFITANPPRSKASATNASVLGTSTGNTSRPTCARNEHPFRVIKRQLGYTKVRYRGLAKSTAQVPTLFALSNLWMKRKQLLHAMGSMRL